MYSFKTDSLMHFDKVAYPFKQSQNVEQFYHPNLNWGFPSACLGQSVVSIRLPLGL